MKRRFALFITLLIFLCLLTAKVGVVSAVIVEGDIRATAPWVNPRASQFASNTFQEIADYAATNGLELRVYDTRTLEESVTIDCALSIEPSGKIRQPTNQHYTLTINGPFHATYTKVFDGFSAGEVTFGSGAVAEAYPEWWGAVADNSTDCASAINAAVAAFPNGGKVKFPSTDNSYKVTSSIEVPSGVTLEGSNYSVYEDGINTIHYTESAQAILSKEGYDDTGTSVDIRLRNMSVKVTHDGATAIWLQAARRCSLENVNITLINTNQTGIRLKGEKDEEAEHLGVFYSFFKQIKITGKGPVSVNSGGTGYTKGDVLTISGGNSNATVKVISVDGSTVDGLQLVPGGSGYNVGTNISTTGGSGTNCKVNIDEVTGGVITRLSIANGGANFSVGDLLTISGGHNNAMVKVVSIGGGGTVTQVEPTVGGTGYSTGTGVSTTRGTGTGCTVNINFVVGGVITTQQTGLYLTGATDNGGQVNANTFVEINVETATNGIVIGPSYNNRFFGATFENITNKAIDFQDNADTNTFHNVYFEKIGTCITFFDDASGNTDAINNTVFTPFFGANITTDIYPGSDPNYHTGVNI